jgi:hypothetical protein
MIVTPEDRTGTPAAERKSDGQPAPDAGKTAAEPALSGAA